MKNLIRISAVFICVLLLCSCAPDNSAQITQSPVSSSALTAEPTTAQTPESNNTAATEQSTIEYQRDNWNEIWNILVENGWSTYVVNTYDDEYAEYFFPAAKSALKEMIPYISAIISAADKIDKPYQKYTPIDSVENENDINNQEYTAQVLANVICTCGSMYPEAQAGLGSVVMVPEKALKDYMRICFSDYTDDTQIPEPADITHTDGTYRYTKQGSTSLPTTGYLISDMQCIRSDDSSENDRFYILAIEIDHPDSYGSARGWKILLKQNDEPDNLGINWRVEKIVRLNPMSDGIDICD